MVMRPGLMFCLKIVALTQRREAKLKMVRSLLRVSRIGHESIRRTAQDQESGEKVREVRLRWCGCVQRRESGGAG